MILLAGVILTKDELSVNYGKLFASWLVALSPDLPRREAIMPDAGVSVAVARARVTSDTGPPSGDKLRSSNQAPQWHALRRDSCLDS